MTDNRNNPNRKRRANGQTESGNRPTKRRTSQSEPVRQETGGLSSTVKGTIAIMITLMVVVIVILLFAKSLFVGNDSKNEQKKTGALNTNISYVDPPQTTASQTQATTSATDDEDDDDDDEDDNEETTSKAKDKAAAEIECTSAVYLHPEPNSTSANLDTIPAGAKVKYYKNENGWYYVEYNGQKGYAWNTFFTAPPADANSSAQ